MTTHKEALKAASEQIGIGMWVIQTCVGAYLSARAETHLTQWPALGCPACNADNLLADFRGDE